MKLAGNGSAAKEVSQYTMQTTSSKLSANHGLLKPCSPLLGGRVTVYTAAKQEEEEEEVCACVYVSIFAVTSNCSCPNAVKPVCICALLLSHPHTVQYVPPLTSVSTSLHVTHCSLAQLLAHDADLACEHTPVTRRSTCTHTTAPGTSIPPSELICSNCPFFSEHSPSLRGLTHCYNQVLANNLLPLQLPHFLIVHC